MNNKEFISDLTNRTQYNNREVTSLVNAVVSVITNELTEENTVAIQGFGTFEVKKKLERVLFNPITKQRMLVPPKMTVSFKPNTSLKDRVKQNQSEESGDF
ncbi:MAG: HU family DNA-binding protein [Prevotellaceae bacterium]|nr:HU family DNA-binding protein [Prevotellaceae bacterium]